MLEILGTIVGIIYLWYEYKADNKVWIAGVIMPAISLYVYWEAGLFADFGINIYYLVVALYGLWAWSRHKGDDGQEVELEISRTPMKMWGVLTVLFVVVFVGIGYVLKEYTPSNVPWWDSLTTALSIIGMWMLARKWIEQWWVWLVVDAVSCGLYIFKDLYFYAGLYGVYCVVVIFGYLEWKRLMDSKQK